MNRIKRSFICTAAAALAFSSGAAAFSASAEWHKNNTGYYYTLEDGGRLTGWQKIDDGKYYFSDDGIAVTGFRKIKGHTYYFDPKKKGKMTTGWKTVDGRRYYFGTNGVMRTGWETIKGKTYYFSSSGKAATGRVRIGGAVYTFSDKGVLQSTSDNSSVSDSSSVYADSAFGNASYGMTFEEVIKANSLKNYSVYGETDDHRIICSDASSYLGSKSEEISVLFFFDTSDKLIAVIAADPDEESAKAWEKYARDKFGEPAAEQENSALYADKKTNMTIFLFSSDGNDLIMEMNADDYDAVYAAFDSLRDEL